MAIKHIDSSDLVVHHAYEVGIEDLMRFCITKSHSSPMLYWSGGIIFYFESIPPIMNHRIEEDFVNGKEHWAEVYYSKMKEYKDTLELSDGDFRGAKVHVINASKFQMHSDFAKWAASR